MVPLRYGLGNVDWQQRINWEELRRKRVERANQFMAKYGIGAAFVYNHDRKRYLTGVWNHPYERAIPSTFVLFVRDNGYPYVPVESHLDQDRVTEHCPWIDECGMVKFDEEIICMKMAASITEAGYGAVYKEA